VVADLFLTETSRRADIVLPAAGWGEKDGTFTNTERRVQRLRPAVMPPGEAKPDWWMHFGDLRPAFGGSGTAPGLFKPGAIRIIRDGLPAGIGPA
jgi:predicted molibdopterin-dependent oxidoreductase YjgC